MQKIFINKDTDLVEQILKVESADEINDSYFDNCYAIIDNEDKIKAYNLRYDRDKDEFIIVEGMKERDEVIVVPSEIEILKREIEELKRIINN